jgi:hypothetical protein
VQLSSRLFIYVLPLEIYLPFTDRDGWDPINLI